MVEQTIPTIERDPETDDELFWELVEQLEKSDTEEEVEAASVYYAKAVGASDNGNEVSQGKDTDQPTESHPPNGKPRP